MCVRVSRKFSLCNFTLESGIRAQSPWLCVFEGMSLLHSEGSVRGATGILLRCPFFFFFFLWGQKQAQVCFSYKPEGTWWFLTSVANSSLAGQSDHSFPQVLQESSGHRRKKKKKPWKKKTKPKRSCSQQTQCRCLTPGSTPSPTHFQSDVCCLWSTLRISFSLLTNTLSFFLSWEQRKSWLFFICKLWTPEKHAKENYW